MSYHTISYHIKSNVQCRR